MKFCWPYSLVKNILNCWKLSANFHSKGINNIISNICKFNCVLNENDFSILNYMHNISTIKAGLYLIAYSCRVFPNRHLRDFLDYHTDVTLVLEIISTTKASICYTRRCLNGIAYHIYLESFHDNYIQKEARKSGVMFVKSFLFTGIAYSGRKSY